MAKAAQIAVAQIVTKDHNEIGPPLRALRECE
jgi:hypothetical protein